MKVTDLVTQHPGGWADIVAACRAYAPEKVVVVSTSSWTDDHIMKTKRGATMSSVTVVPVFAGMHDDKCKLIDVLDADIPGVSGEIAAGIYRIFLKYGIPVPGDKLWMKPASTWDIWRAI